MLSRCHISSFTILCNYSVYLPVYYTIKMSVLLLSFGRIYGRYLVPRLFYLQLTIHRLMVRLKDKKIPIEEIIHCIVHKGSTNWLYSTLIKEFAINYLFRIVQAYLQCT